MIEQTNIFDLGVIDKHYDYEKYFKPGTKIRLFEAFAGIGCQAMAFKRLGIPYESVGISEIDKYAIINYATIHHNLINVMNKKCDDNNEILRQTLKISINDRPLYKNYLWVKKALKTANELVKNYGDICKMTEIPLCDIFTWSFPCTDLSKAGKQKGLNGTQSGLVYEVLRLLHATEDKPKVLIMENVVDLVQEKFKAKFYEIQKEIESLGYKNYTTTLNAKHYGVAQNRDRVFMVSLLGGGRYEFPPRERLEKRLKDYLEKNVDDKYYLSEKMIKGMQETSFNTYSMERSLKNDDDIASAIIARFEGCPQCVEDEPVCLNSKVNGKQPSVQDRIYDTNGTSTAITTSFMPSIAIPEATKQGYALAGDGDGVYINRPHQKRGVVQKGMIQTIKTSGDDIGVVVDTYNKKVLDNQNVIGTITANTGTYGHCGNFTLNNGLRIRKLTPKECWRLMGINDEDFDKASKVCSNAQLYKQAGNGIVVDVFAGILQGLI